MVIIQQALYRDDVVHIIAHPYIPMTNTLIYQIQGESAQSTEFKTIMAKIQISRTRINSAPSATKQAVLALLTGIKSAEPNANAIEQINFTKPTSIVLDAVSLFTATLGTYEV